jgi:branched-chain amino acid transport system permease protein
VIDVLPSLVFTLKSLAYASAIGLLSMGLTLTYMTTKVPNFAHATVAMIGAVVMLLLVDHRYYYNPTWGMYLTGTIIGGAVAAAFAVLMYIAILKPLAARGNTVIGLMIATFAVDILLVNILTIYLNSVQGVNIKQYISASLESFQPRIKIAGSPIGGATIILPIAAVLLAYLFHLFLTKTKFGVAMRATIENPGLAEVMGVNTNLVYMVSWAVSGFLAGVAGSLMSFTFKNINPAVSALIIVSVFAGSIVGGLSSLYWGLIGGFIVGLSEKLITQLISMGYSGLVHKSVSFANYEKLVSLTLVIIVLLYAPEGLAGVNWGRLFRRGRR